MILLMCLMATDTPEIKAMVAALHFIFTTATKFNTEHEVLAAELSQLGLPKGGSYMSSFSCMLLTRANTSTGTTNRCLSL
jgi:hypothetical protein